MSAQGAQSKWLVPFLVVLVLLSAGGVLAFTLSREHRVSGEQRERQELLDKGPKVRVVTVKAMGGERLVTVPGDVRAFNQATLYAKVSGYLKEIRVDKGERVKKNQIIGVLESPETDQQVAAARADLMIKQRDAARAQSLAPKGVVSEQELDTANANVKIAKANLARVRALKEYEVVRAPFDGTVTGRYVDVGALLPAATGSTSAALPVVDLADTDKVRVTVFAGQDVAPFLRSGDLASVSVDERPDLKIDAKVTLCSKALDPRSRAMLCEIWLDNRQYQLYPGSFVHVTLHVKTPMLPSIPSDAVITRNGNLFAAVVRGDNVSFARIEPGLNDGKTLQVANGLRGGERVALNLPSELSDGARIQPELNEPAVDPSGGTAIRSGPSTGGESAPKALNNNR